MNITFALPWLWLLPLVVCQAGAANPAAGLTDIAAVSAGYNENLALKKDGRVVMWSDSPAIQGVAFTNAVAIVPLAAW